jgi:hypothetical protein
VVGKTGKCAYHQKCMEHLLQFNLCKRRPFQFGLISQHHFLREDVIEDGQKGLKRASKL